MFLMNLQKYHPKNYNDFVLLFLDMWLQGLFVKIMNYKMFIYLSVLCVNENILPSCSSPLKGGTCNSSDVYPVDGWTSW